MRVKPIYGYGWFRKDTSFDEVPPMFELSVNEKKTDGDLVKLIYGQVPSKGHTLDGYHVLLVHRSQWPDGQAYNLFARRKPYQFEKLELVHERPDAEITGFVMIDNKEQAR